MSNIQSEKDYQRYILERLEKDNGYIIRKAVNYDRYFALDREMLFKFLNDTQPDTMAALKKVYKDAMEEIFRMYRPLLIKNSMDNNMFDEDLYQELSATLLNCIRNFKF